MGTALRVQNLMPKVGNNSSLQLSENASTIPS